MAQSVMTTVYVLLATAAAMVVAAGLLWFGVIDIGVDDPGPLAPMLVVGALMDIGVSTLLLVRTTRR